MGEPGGTWIPEPMWVTFYLKRGTTCLKSLLLSLVFVKALDTKPRTKTEATDYSAAQNSLSTPCPSYPLIPPACLCPTQSSLGFQTTASVQWQLQRRLKPSEPWRVRSGNGGDKRYKQLGLAGFMLGMALLFRRAPTLSPPSRDWPGGARGGNLSPVGAVEPVRGLRRSHLLHWKVLASLVCCKSNFTIKADILIFIFLTCVCS